jgi:hypothetical protein
MMFAAASPPTLVQRTPDATRGRRHLDQRAHGRDATGRPAYLAQVIVQRTGMPAADADQLAHAHGERGEGTGGRRGGQGTRSSRRRPAKATAYTALWMFVSLRSALSAHRSRRRGGGRRATYGLPPQSPPDHPRKTMRSLLWLRSAHHSHYHPDRRCSPDDARRNEER